MQKSADLPLAGNAAQDGRPTRIGSRAAIFSARPRPSSDLRESLSSPEMPISGTSDFSPEHMHVRPICCYRYALSKVEAGLINTTGASQLALDSRLKLQASSLKLQLCQVPEEIPWNVQQIHALMTPSLLLNVTRCQCALLAAK